MDFVVLKSGIRMLSTCFKRARVRPSLNGLKSRAAGRRRKWLWSRVESHVWLITRVLLITVSEMSVTWKHARRLHLCQCSFVACANADPKWHLQIFKPGIGN